MFIHERVCDGHRERMAANNIVLGVFLNTLSSPEETSFLFQIVAAPSLLPLPQRSYTDGQTSTADWFWWRPSSFYLLVPSKITNETVQQQWWVALQAQVLASCLHSPFSFLLSLGSAGQCNANIVLLLLSLLSLLIFQSTHRNCVLDSIEFLYKFKNKMENGVCTRKKKRLVKSGCLGSPIRFQW